MLLAAGSARVAAYRAHERREAYFLVEFSGIGQTACTTKVIGLEEDASVEATVECILGAFSHERMTNPETIEDTESSGDYALFAYEKIGKTGQKMRYVSAKLGSDCSGATLVCIPRMQTIHLGLPDGTTRDVIIDIANTVRNALNKIAATIVLASPLTSDDADLVFCSKDPFSPSTPLKKDEVLFVEIATQLFGQNAEVSGSNFWWFRDQVALVLTAAAPDSSAATTLSIDSPTDDLCIEFADECNSDFSAVTATHICADRLRSRLAAFRGPNGRPRSLRPYTKVFSEEELCELCDEFICTAESLGSGAAPNTEALCAMADRFYETYYVSLETGVYSSSVPNYFVAGAAYKELWIAAQTELIYILEEAPSHRRTERAATAYRVIKALVSHSKSLFDPKLLCFKFLPRERQRLFAALCYKLHELLTALGSLFSEIGLSDLSRTAIEFGEDVAFSIGLVTPFLSLQSTAENMKEQITLLRDNVTPTFHNAINSRKESDGEWAAVADALLQRAELTIEDILLVPRMQAPPNLDGGQWEVASAARRVLCSLGALKLNSNHKNFVRFYESIRTLLTLIAETVDSNEEETDRGVIVSSGSGTPFCEGNSEEKLSHMRHCAGRLLLHTWWLKEAVIESDYKGSVFTLASTAIPRLLRDLITACPWLGALSTECDRAILEAPGVDMLADTITAEAETLRLILRVNSEDEVDLGKLLESEKIISKEVTTMLLGLTEEKNLGALIDNTGRKCVEYANTLSQCFPPLEMDSVLARLKRSAVELLLILSSYTAPPSQSATYLVVTPLLSGLETAIAKGVARSKDKDVLRDFFYAKLPTDDTRNEKEAVAMQSMMIVNELGKTLRVIGPAMRWVCCNVCALGKRDQQCSEIAELAEDILEVTKNKILRSVHKACALLLLNEREDRVRELEKLCTRLLREIYCAAEAAGLGDTKHRLFVLKDLDNSALEITKIITSEITYARGKLTQEIPKHKTDMELICAATRLRMVTLYFDGVRLQKNSRLAYLMEEIVTIANVAGALIAAVIKERQHRREQKVKTPQQPTVDNQILELSRSVAGTIVFVAGTFLDYVMTGTRTLQALEPACSLLHQYVAQINAVMSGLSTDSDTFVCDIISASAALDVSLKALTLLLDELRPPDSLDTEDDTQSLDDIKNDLISRTSQLEELQKKRLF